MSKIQKWTSFNLFIFFSSIVMLLVEKFQYLTGGRIGFEPEANGVALPMCHYHWPFFTDCCSHSTKAGLLLQDIFLKKCYIKRPSSLLIGWPVDEQSFDETSWHCSSNNNNIRNVFRWVLWGQNYNCQNGSSLHISVLRQQTDAIHLNTFLLFTHS